MTLKVTSPRINLGEGHPYLLLQNATDFLSYPAQQRPAKTGDFDSALTQPQNSSLISDLFMQFLFYQADMAKTDLSS